MNAAVDELAVDVDMQGVAEEGVATRARPGRPLRLLRRFGPPTAVVGGVVGIWYMVSYFALNATQRFLLPPPHQVVKVGILTWGNFHQILDGFVSTAIVALIAFALSSLIGMIFAILMSEAGWIERSFYPLAVVVQTLPFLAIVPLVGFWFGYDFQSRLIVSTIVSLFPITTNALFGLKSVDPGHSDLFRLFHTSRWVRLWRLKFPGALPSIFSGLRISAGLCVIASIVTDFFIRNGAPGLGGLLDLYASELQSEKLFTALFMSALLGIAVYLAVTAAAHKAIGKWHSSYIVQQVDD
jgi:NitT/TauT family transport system permease protein